MENFNKVLFRRISKRLPKGEMKVAALKVLSEQPKIQMLVDLRILQFLINMDPQSPVGKLAAFVVAGLAGTKRGTQKYVVLNNLGIVAQDHQWKGR